MKTKKKIHGLWYLGAYVGLMLFSLYAMERCTV